MDGTTSVEEFCVCIEILRATITHITVHTLLRIYDVKESKKRARKESIVACALRGALTI